MAGQGRAKDIVQRVTMGIEQPLRMVLSTRIGGFRDEVARRRGERMVKEDRRQGT